MPYSVFTGLSKKLWQGYGQAIFEQITLTPLVTGLIKGLPPEKFHRFTWQDIHYLEKSFQPAMKVLRNKATDPAHQKLFSDFIAATEIELTQLKKQVLLVDTDDSMQPSKVCIEYGKHLLETTRDQPYSVGVAALKPCFLYFPLVGLYIKNKVSNLAEHPQAGWITVYAEELFDNAHLMANLFNKVTQHISAEEENRVTMAYTISAYHERHFFIDALPKEENNASIQMQRLGR